MSHKMPDQTISRGDPPQNQRKQPRLDLKVTAKYKVPSQMDIAIGSIKNISAGGICLLTPNLMKPGQHLMLEFELPGMKTMVLHGKVMWSDTLKYPEGEHVFGYAVEFPFHMGVQFEQIDDNISEAIQSFVVSRLRLRVREEMKSVPQHKKCLKKLLVIDYDSVVRTLVQKIFMSEFDVITAADGHTGVEMAMEMLPDIVFLDLVMPGLDGFSTLALLKDFPETKDIPVLILSDLRKTSKVFQAIKDGATDYILKPFTAERLIATTRHILYGE